MTTNRADRPIQIGDVVVIRGPIGGPPSRVTAFGHMADVPSPGPSARVESLRREEKDGAKPAWLGEFLIGSLRVLPEGHYARRAPYYAFADEGDAAK